MSMQWNRFLSITAAACLLVPCAAQAQAPLPASATGEWRVTLPNGGKGSGVWSYKNLKADAAAGKGTLQLDWQTLDPKCSLVGKDTEVTLKDGGFDMNFTTLCGINATVELRPAAGGGLAGQGKTRQGAPLLLTAK